MMLVDAGPVETELLGVLEFVEIAVVQEMSFFGVVELVG